MKINIAHLIEPRIMIPIIFKEGRKTEQEIDKKHKNFAELFEVLLNVAESEELTLEENFVKIATDSDAIEISTNFTDYPEEDYGDDDEEEYNYRDRDQEVGDFYIYFDNFGYYVNHEKDYTWENR